MGHKGSKLFLKAIKEVPKKDGFPRTVPRTPDSFLSAPRTPASKAAIPPLPTSASNATILLPTPVPSDYFY